MNESSMCAGVTSHVYLHHLFLRIILKYRSAALVIIVIHWFLGALSIFKKAADRVTEIQKERVSA